MKHVSIVVTERCNMHCKMCDIGQSNEGSGLSKNWMGSEISPSEWIEIIEKINPERISISGVEPTLYKGLDELLFGLKDRYLMLTTNGLLFNKHKEAIVECCNNVSISIDGLRKTHDYIRGAKGSFDKSINALKYLVDNGVYTRVSYCINPDSLKDMVELYKIVMKIGVNQIIFNHYNYIHPRSCHGYGCKSSNLSFYDPKDVNIDKLFNNIKACKRARFYPNITNKKSLWKYYNEIPIRCINKRCLLLEDIMKKNRATLNPSGKMTPPGRCWVEDIDDMPEVINHIKEDGLPPPCQRLCCAGKCV